MLSPHQARRESRASTVDALTARAIEQASGLRNRSANGRSRERSEGPAHSSTAPEWAASCPACGHRDLDRELQGVPPGGNGQRETDALRGALHVGNAGLSTTAPPLTLSMSEAAHLLGIGVSTAYRLCSRGEFPIPLLRIGGIVKVSSKRLRDYVEAVDDASEG